MVILIKISCSQTKSKFKGMDLFFYLSTVVHNRKKFSKAKSRMQTTIFNYLNNFI